MQELFLPVLHSFENNNVFTGSYGELRFKITPSITMATPKEVDFEQSSMQAEVWYGQFCYEKSTVEDLAVFPLSIEGRQQMYDWLIGHAENAKNKD